MLRAALAAALVLLAPPVVRADAPLVVGAGEDHLWLVAPDLSGRGPMQLYHHAGDAEGPWFVQRRSLSRLPEGLAVWERRVWLALPPDRDAPERRREVFSLHLVAGPMGAWLVQPPQRFGVEPPLPGDGRLVGFCGGPDGPIALLMPAPGRRIDDGNDDSPDKAPADAPPAAGADDAAAPAWAGDRPLLLQLEGRRWTPLPLPDDVAPGPARLIAPASGGHGLLLLTADPANNRSAVIHRRSRDGTWRRSTVELDPRSVRDADRRGGSALVARHLPVPLGEAPLVELAYLRRDALLPLAEWRDEAEAWALAGMRDGLHLVELRAAAEGSAWQLMMRDVDPISGAIGIAAPMTPPPPQGGAVFNLSLLLALAVTAVLLLLVFRPGGRGVVALPPGLRAASAGTRFLALAIDLLPGIGLALLGGAEPAELLRAPLLLSDFGGSTGYLVVVGVTVLHTSASEIILARTLGKHLVGARVVTGEGDRPGAARLAARNAIKLLTLLAPPLALIALVNPHLQCAHDLFARTVVVSAGSEAGEGDERQ